VLAASPITSEEYLNLPDEFDQWGNRIRDELIGGEVVKYPIQPLSHDLPRNEVAEALIRYLLANEHLELTVMITTGFLVSKYDTFVPDVSVVENKQLGREDVRITEGPPAIAIEVVAPTDKEVHLRRKIDAYRENGSKTVWVVHPSARSVVIYSGGAIREVKGDQLIEDPLLPGFSFPVSHFFDRT
jgi:Uma2 family endonuclease